MPPAPAPGERATGTVSNACDVSQLAETLRNRNTLYDDQVFSSRLPPDLARNRLTRALDALRATRRPFIDLTESNPTRAGFDYPAELVAPLGHCRGLTYAPQPL